MNYQTIYDNLIHKAQNRQLVGYTERHHIIPKSLGGSNKKDNLVHLTAREHYVAHRLLVKIYKPVGGEAHKKMVYAMWFLSKTLVEQRKISSRAYETARLAFSELNPNKDEARKERFRGNHAAGLYKYDYTKVSLSLKSTLSQMSADEMHQRMKAVHNCDQEKRKDAIKRGKGSLLLLTRPDGSTQEFWSYDDVRSITGKSYDSVKFAIRTQNGLLANGNRVQYIQRYNTINRYTKTK